MLSKRILNLSPSPTLSLDAKVKQLQADGKKIINLTLGEPDFNTPEYIRIAAKEAIDSGFTHYAPPAGILELRELISKKLEKENGLIYNPQEIIVGVGSKQLLHSVFQVLCEDGDEVIVPTPTWSTYIEQIKLSGATPVLAPLLPPFKLTAKDIEQKITPRTKAIIINNPSNPTGAVVEKTELANIGELAVQKNIFIIADEIYEKIIFEGSHFSVGSFSPVARNQTITINGFSKAYAMTGWRIGYAAGPRDIIYAMVALAGQTTSGTSSISQKAAVAAFGNDSEIKLMTNEFRRRRAFLFVELSKIDKIQVLKPEGAFYIFPDIRKLFGGKYNSSAEWAIGLLEDVEVAVVPGEAFCAPGFIRISFATSIDNIKEGVRRITDFVLDS